MPAREITRQRERLAGPICLESLAKHIVKLNLRDLEALFHGVIRAFAANPIHAVVMRQGHGRDYEPGGTIVFLTNASAQHPLQPFDDDDARRLIENCWIKARKQHWALGHPPQKTERAVQVHVMFIRLMCALAMAYRRLCEQDAMGGESVALERWRRQLLAETHDKVHVFAQGYYGILHLAESSLRLGVKLIDVLPNTSSLPQVLAK